MRKLSMICLAIAAALLFGAASARAQSSPGLVNGQIPQAAQWNGYFAGKQDYLGFTPLNPANNGTDFASESATLVNLSGAPQVANLAALQATTTATYPAGVWRITDGIAGAPPLFFMPLSGTCAANSFVNDGGNCVNTTSGGNAWKAKFPNGVGDVREWGAVANGVTDAGPAINNCLLAQPECTIPASTSGFYINTTVLDRTNSRITGVNVAQGTNFAGTSFFLCSSSITPCVQMGDGTAYEHPSMQDLVVSRVSGTPASGTIGILWDADYNSSADHVLAYNHDTCSIWQTGTSIGGLAFTGNDYKAAACATHYLTFDGWVQANFYAGRIGTNGAGDYAAQDYVYFTNSNCDTAGCGPNTIAFFGTQFNSGSFAPACIVRWGNYNVSAAGTWTLYKFIGTHEEGNAGAAKTGVFCSDSTVPYIAGLDINDAEFNPDDGTTPIFALNAATALQYWNITNSEFSGGTTFSLAPAPAGVHPGFLNVNIQNNLGPNGAASFTSSGTYGNYLTSKGNAWSSTTIAGDWDGALTMNELEYGTITDTATGHIYMSEPPQAWTPILNTGGSPTGWTLSTDQGTWARTPSGGIEGNYTIVVTGKSGVTSGSVSITGLSSAPGCNQTNGAGLSILQPHTGWASLTGFPAMQFQTSTQELDPLMVNTGATGDTPVTDANLTSTAHLHGDFACAVAK